MNLILNDTLIRVVKLFLPYLIAFLLGVIVAWRGCGNTSSETINTIIEKPVPKIEYVDRWKYDTVRHVTTKIVTVTDTIHDTRIVSSLDTLFLIDTVKIVEAWLSEVVQYDTTAPVGGGVLRLRWQNYQNLTENIQIDYSPKVVRAKFALGLHGNAGLISDFKRSYVPLMGVGVQATVNRNYYRVDYGFNGRHYIGIGVGRNIISR